MKIFRIITTDGLVLTLEGSTLHEVMLELAQSGYKPSHVIQLG